MLDVLIGGRGGGGDVVMYKIPLWMHVSGRWDLLNRTHQNHQ